MMGSIVATNLVMSRQTMWLEAIERRISATTEMLGTMKGVKMCGMTETLAANIQALRVEELRISKKFRKLLIWNMGFSKCILTAAQLEGCTRELTCKLQVISLPLLLRSSHL